MPDGINVAVSPQHAAARAYAARGLPVFPCRVGGKAPATAHSFRDATTDLATIDRWFGAADYNIAFAPDSAGWCVVDLDPKNGGDAAWQALIAENPVSPTFEVETPSGGRHLYFAGRLPPSAGKLAPGVDIRGGGSYVLLPPSVVDGREYRGGSFPPADFEIAPLPPWIPARLGRQDRTVHEAPTDAVLDDPRTVEWFKAKIAADLAAHGPPEEGERSDERTFHLIGAARDGDRYGYSLRPETIADLLHAHWAPHFDQDWLWAKAERALDVSRYQNKPGCGPAGSGERMFGAAVATLPVERDAAGPKREDAPADGGDFPLFFTWQFGDRPEPSYLIDGLIRDKALTILYGPSETYKTFLLIDLLASVTIGIPALGHFPLVRTGDAVLCLDEDPDDAMRGRYPAWCKARGIDPFANPPARPDGIPAPGRFAIVPRVPYVAQADQVEKLIADIKRAELRPAIVALDTAAKAMLGLNQNAAENVGLLIAAMTRLRREFGCAVVAVHHPNKDDAAQMRGSGAFTNDTDAAILTERIADLRVRVTLERVKTGPKPPPFVVQGALYDVGLKDHYPAFTYASPGAASHAASHSEKCDAGQSEIVWPVVAALRALTTAASPYVSTATLVGEMYPREPDETAEDYSARSRARGDELGRLASDKPTRWRGKNKGRLADFVQRSAKGDQLLPYRWHLPDRYRDDAPVDY